MTDRTAFHQGELAAQERAGVRDEANRVHAIVGDTLSAGAAGFLAAQRMLVLGAVDEAGDVWAGLLHGEPGFIQPRDARTVDVHATPAPADPLAGVLANPAAIGTLAIDLAHRRRFRMNGRSTPIENGLRLRIDQAYGNCPKYIQRRTVGDQPATNAAVVEDTTSLTSGQQRMIAAADTFFIATISADGDADASHRGGEPGFVEVLSPARLRWPDYAGNAMLMTIGNVVQNPSAGLLFRDWRTGVTLQLTGTATIDWSAERTIEFEVRRAVRIAPQGTVPQGTAAEPPG
jgi:predicted pyridoxine 5'-phosphate oxidase superfamily flavin-nucleotide-binding protein